MKNFQYILFIFSTVFSYGQVSLETIVDQHEFMVNEKFTLTVVMEIQGDNYVQQSKLKLPDFSKFNMIGNASEQNTIRDGNVVVNQIVYQCVLEPKQAGKLKIGSALVTVNDKIYKTEPFDITVKEADKKSLAKESARTERVDVFLDVELKKNEVYVNQPTIAVLRAYTKNYSSFRKIKNVQLPQQDHAVVKAVSYDKSDIESGANQLSSQVLAVYMVLPDIGGNMEIEPATASVLPRNKNILSNKVKLKVKELPSNAPDGYKNAVGKFAVQILNQSPEKVEVKKPLNVLVKVSGEGNFTNLQLPKLVNSPNYVIYPPKITDQTQITKNGIEGEILANYVVVPNRAGAFAINLEDFSYFDPESEQYVSVDAKSLDINVFTHEELLSARTPMERVNEYTNTVLETVDNPVLQTDDLIVEEKKKINWKVILLNLGLLLGAITLFMLFRKWQKNNQKNDKNSVAQPLENVSDAEEKIRKSMQADEEDYFVFLKKSVEAQNYEEFFKGFAELDQLTQNNYGASQQSEFISILERENGGKMVEEYRELIQKIQIEKYAPTHQNSEINRLLEMVINFYKQIKK